MSPQLHIITGRNPGLEQQLVQKSRQSHITKFTPNDAATRFSDPQALGEWISKGRRIYWLVGPGNDLAGIIWFGPKQLPIKLSLPEQPTDTFAIRLYQDYLGKGLAVPFFAQSLALETNLRQKRGEPAPSLWLETGADNPAALATYAKIGYHQVHATPDRITMVLPSADVERITTRETAKPISYTGESV